MDSAVFFFIHFFSGSSSAVDALGIFFAEYAIYILAGIVLFLMCVDPVRGRISGRGSILFLMTTIIPLSINALIGIFAFRQRPFLTYDIEPLITIAESTKSFPSDHATVAFALALLGAHNFRRGRLLFFACAFLIALARIFVGVHYPSDILVGATIGMICAQLISHFYEKST